MEFTKEQKSNKEIVPAVDVELNDKQLELVAGGVWGGIDGGGCTDPLNPIKDLLEPLTTYPTSR